MGSRDWIRLVLLSLVWGISFFLVEIALLGSEPLTIVLIRVSLAALALHIYCYFKGILIWPGRRLAGSLCLLGLIFNVIPFSLITFGQTSVDSGLAAIFIATTPLCTVALAHFWGRAESATPAKLAGVTAGIIGVGVLMGPDAFAGISGNIMGKAALLVAAVFYALSAVYGKRFKHLPPATVAAWMLTFAGIIIAPLASFFETPFSSIPETGPLAAMVTLALLSTACAYIIYFNILASAGATNAMLVTFMQPPLAIMLGIVFLGEMLEWYQLAGLAIILTGLALVDGRIIEFAGARMKRAKDAV